MKKRIFLIINYVITFIFLFVFLKISYASTTGKVYLSSNKNKIEKEEEIEINLLIENTKTAAFTSYLYFDDTKFEYVSGPENTNVVGNCILLVWYDETGGNAPKSGELTKFKFKAKEEGGATFTVNGEFYNETGQLIQTDFKEIQLQVGEIQNKRLTENKKTDSHTENTQVSKTENVETANTNLEILAIENELLNPPFDAGTTNYQVEISNETTNLNVLAVPEDEKATVQIEGKDNLKEGNNFLKVTVRAQNGVSEKRYEVNVYKRNLEEEAKYQEQVKENQEKLEQIYKTQKLSSQSEEKEEENQKKNYQKVILIILGTTIILRLVILIKFKK